MDQVWVSALRDAASWQNNYAYKAINKYKRLRRLGFQWGAGAGAAGQAGPKGQLVLRMPHMMFALLEASSRRPAAAVAVAALEDVVGDVDGAG